MNNHKNENVIPVVFAVNNDYTYFGYIAIYSLIKHINSDSIYGIYVLVTDVDKKNQELLESLSRKNVEVKCLDISDFTKDVTLKESIHLSVETYYRLFIPIVLPQYERIIYLDSDICVLDDVAKMLKYDLCGKSVGVVRDVQCGHLKKHSLEIGNLDYRKTFNAGVLVMDTRKFENDKVRDKCLAILNEDYKRKVRRFIFADQDALNVVLYENVCFIDDEWNVQSQFAWRPQTLTDEYKNRYFTLLDSAKIMHFAGDRKPWMYPELPKADVFWDIAKESDVFREVLESIIEKVRKNASKLNCFDGFQFPYKQVPFGSKIAVYGAGVVGKTFVMQNRLTGYVEITLWVDKNARNLSDPEVYDVETLLTGEFEYLIIAIDDEDTAMSIKKSLLSLGIPKDKIVWDKYLQNNNRKSKG